MGSRDHSITCEVCGLQRGGLNDDKCACDVAWPVVAAAIFDTRAARDAVKAFDAAQLSALAVAGYLPSAVDRIDVLEDACRGCLRVIDGVEERGATLQVLAAILRSALERAAFPKPKHEVEKT